MYDPAEPFQMLVSDLSYSDFFGRQANGKVIHGNTRAKDALVCLGENGAVKNLNVTKLQTYQGITLVETDSAVSGDIIVLSGIADVTIGDTICTRDAPKALPRIVIDEPTVSMRFSVNTSPIAGTEGKNPTSTILLERLKKETLKNVSLQVDEENRGGGFIVRARGEFQLVILIETLRREGFELGVTRPEVIFKYVDGKKMEPIEHVYIDCAEVYAGNVTMKLNSHKGRMLAYTSQAGGRVHLEFSVPSRALLGYRDEFLTDTKGTGIMNTIFAGFEEYRGDFDEYTNGFLVSDHNGVGVTYGLFHLEPHGYLYIVAGEPVYEGMVIGQHNLRFDLVVNPSKEKKLSNMRSTTKDEALTLTPIQPMTLERAILLLQEEEMVEVTPKSVRIRKILLSEIERKKVSRASKKEGS